MARALDSLRKARLQAHQQVLLLRPDEREEVDGALDLGIRRLVGASAMGWEGEKGAYCSHERPRDDGGVGRGGYRDAPDAVDHLAEADLTRDF